jgi:HD-GYP domain-containing protein (c-di-GMP phosphodiesterase class II)
LTVHLCFSKRSNALSQDARQIERSRGIIKFLDNTIKNMALYPPDHPSVKGVAKRSFDLLNEIFETRDQVVIGIINGVLYLDDYLFYDPTPYSDNFLRLLNSFEIDNLFFRKGISEENFLKFAVIMNSRERSRQDFIRMLQERGLDEVGLKSFSLGEETGDLLTKGLETYRDAIGTMRGFFTEIGDGKMPPLREAEQLVEGYIDQMGSNRSALMLLSSLKGYDAYTYQHCVNVGILALLLGEKEGLDEQKLKWAALAGMMHDVGKVRVPSEVVNKPGGLTMREWEAMKRHPDHSADVMRGMGGAEALTLAVEGHHMYYDGGGYPIRADKTGPSILAGLIAVVDAYDAITTVRSYKRPMSPVEAVDFLEKGRGNRFDPFHVDTFISMVGSYPPGATIRLSSNEIGIVTRAGENPGKPTVRMILDDGGLPVDSGEEVDLAGPQADGRVVAAVVDPALYNLQAEAAFT